MTLAALVGCSYAGNVANDDTKDDAADIVSELNYAGVPNVDACIGVSDSNAVQFFLPPTEAAWAPEIAVAGINTSDTVAVYPAGQSPENCNSLGGVPVNIAGEPSSTLSATVATFPNGRQFAVANMSAYAGGGPRCPNGETVGFSVALNPYGTTPEPLNIYAALNPFACEFENWYTNPVSAGSDANSAFSLIDCSEIAQGNVSVLDSPNIGGGQPICLFYDGPTAPPQAETPGPEAPGAGLEVFN